MTNREFLEDAGLLPRRLKLTKKEVAVIESLTKAELEFLVSIRKKVKVKVDEVDMMIAPPTHHF